MQTEVLTQEASKYTDLLIGYAGEYGVKFFAAVAIFVVGRWVAQRLTKLSKGLMQKAKVDETLVSFSANIIQTLLFLVVIMASLGAMGINTTSFVAVLGAATLAIGLALQGSVSNIGAAALIIIFRPFKVGDLVEAGGAYGTVIEINLFSTIISPTDNRTIIVPNSKIIGANITNFSLKENRRVEHTFGIGYGDDLKLAKEILHTIIDADSRILKDPEPFVAVGALAASSVDLVVRVWSSNDDYAGVYHDMLESVKLAFDAQGISIPYPQMDLHLDK